MRPVKKILLTLTVFLVACAAAQAVPASREKFKVTQPDGSVILLQNHGDDFYHWTTDEMGHTVEKGADGFYRVSFVSQGVHHSRYNMARARAPYRALWSSYDHPNTINFGDRKVLCFLVEFAPEDPEHPDEHDHFVLENPNEHFTKMLNQSGYNYNGAIGSVRDYFLDNSIDENNQPQYRPQFDVYGPVTLSHPSSYYDSKGVNLAVMEAYSRLFYDIPDVDSYDTDNDGAIDMVLVYCAGYNQAEGGPASTIWPHQSSTTSYYGWMGTKRFNRYFCTSELRGNTGAVGAGIGPTCHEFSHALGLPDMYDANYGTFGFADFTTDTFDLMADGSYNDESRRPPYLSAFERNMLGWMPAPDKIETAGNYVLEGVQNRQAYRIDSRVPGEYFFIECRNGEKWDAGIHVSGMVAYHIDKSDRIVGDGTTAAYLWENTNSINAYGNHPCYVLVPSALPAYEDIGPTFLYYPSGLVFPGRESVTVLEPEDWDGHSSGVKLTDIAFDGTKVTFGATMTVGKLVDGYVKDYYGNPLPGAQVVLSRSVYRRIAAPGLLSTDLSTTTDNDGYYCLELEPNNTDFSIVTAQKDGYFPLSVNLSTTERFSRQDFVLMIQGMQLPATLKKYQYSSMRMDSFEEDTAVGMCYTSAELSEMGVEGATLCDVTFSSFTGMSNGMKVYVVVDFDDEIVLRKDVTSEYEGGRIITIDLSDEHIVIPEGKDVYIGYGITGATNAVFMYQVAEDNGGAKVSVDFLTNTNWETAYSEWGPIAFPISANLSVPVKETFATHGVSYIRIKDGVPQVVPASTKTVYATQWYLDGTPLPGDPTPISELTTGPHTYMARLSFYDGTSERVYYDVTVE